MKLEPGWPEVLIEAALLGVFMFSACVFAWLFEDPASFARTLAPSLLADAFTRRCFMGGAMGLTAIGIFYSPWAKRSGAHINPAVTLTFWKLGRIDARDGAHYAAAQFAGGTLGVLSAALLVGGRIGIPTVNYAVTIPGAGGITTAFAGEVGICFTMMSAVLACQTFAPLRHLGGLACATLLALFIVFESPVSGTSLNPARTFASAVVAGVWTDAWIYFLAPPLGMLAAAELYRRGFAHVCESERANPGFAASMAVPVGELRRTA